MPVTEFQEKVYALLLQIPPGRVASYRALAAALNSSPRAVGGALRRNPFAPEVPCHRVIAASGFVGGFMGDWAGAPSGVNQARKLELLRGEGVEFDEKGFLLLGLGNGDGDGKGDGGKWWDGFVVEGVEVISKEWSK